MTAAHGKDTEHTVDGDDLTEWIKTSNWEVNPDIHDFTGSGTDDKRNRGGQIGRSLTLGGWYDTTTGTGPAILEALAGTTVPIVRKLQGTGTGKPQQAFSAVVGKYVESGKNDDIIQWTCDFAVDGAVATTTQA